MLHGIIVALPQELRTLTREKLLFGSCHRLNEGWMVTMSGMGAPLAREAAHRLLEQNVQGLVSWGAAAALDNRLVTGALLLPEWVLDGNGRRYACDSFPADLLVRELPGTYFISRAPLYGAAPLLESPADKKALYEFSGTVAADMESAAIGAVARTAGVPFSVVRAISDDAETMIPSLIRETIDDRGVVKWPDSFVGTPPGEALLPGRSRLPEASESG